MNYISARLESLRLGFKYTPPVRAPKLTDASQVPHLFRMQDRAAQENDTILQPPGEMLLDSDHVSPGKTESQ